MAFLWLKFAGIQLVCFVTTVIGWVALLPFCVAGAWHTEPSRTPGLEIAVWNYKCLDAIYGNQEDGVLGTASYMVGKPDWLRAYMWSAWRNSTDNLKYYFRRPVPGGPFVRKEFGRWYVQAGWNGRGLPVLSAGAL